MWWLTEVFVECCIALALLALGERACEWLLEISSSNGKDLHECLEFSFFCTRWRRLGRRVCMYVCIYITIPAGGNLPSKFAYMSQMSRRVPSLSPRHTLKRLDQADKYNQRQQGTATSI